MFGLDVQIINNFAKVKEEVKKANFKNLGHALNRLRKDMAESIEISAEPSPEGTPPHSRRGQLKRAFRYDVGEPMFGIESDGIVGPLGSRVGESAKRQEFGGMFQGQEFAERPFIGPALDKNIDRIPGDWEGTFGQ